MIERRVELEMQHDLRITKWMDGAVGLRKINSHLPQYPMPYSVSLKLLSLCPFRINELPFQVVICRLPPMSFVPFHLAKVVIFTVSSGSARWGLWRSYK